jgi:predicted metal-binding protein
MPSWQVLNQCPTHVVQVDRHATVFQRARDFIALRQVLSAVEFSEIMEDVREEALRLGLVHKFSSAVRDALGETLDCIVFEITDGLVLAEGSAERTTRHHA